MIVATKGDREIEKQERHAILQFINSPDVAQVLTNYDRQIRHMYKFYAAMDIKKEHTFDIEYLHSTLDLREFVRFGYQQKIIPSFITPDEMVFVYKQLLSDFQDMMDEG